MVPMLLKDAIEAAGAEYFGDPALPDKYISSVVTDSRKAGEGSLFVALKGENVDGHDFMAKALSGGALCCLSQRKPTSDKETPSAVVPDTLRAVGRIAGLYRRGFDIPVVGITGSVGKTTAKEMAAAVISTKFDTHRTELNYNNELGVPQTLFALEPHHEAAVIEMGISDFGEMTRLTDIVRPNIVIMTIIGSSHLEFLHDREGVLKAKAEIFKSMKETDLAILNGDDDLLSAFVPPVRKVTFGLGENCDYRATEVKSLGADGTDCVISWRDIKLPVHIPAYGVHMVYAALSAAAAGDALGVPPELIAKGIASYKTIGGRSNVIDTGKITIIDDCYNANPTSVRSAIDSIASYEGRRVLILGDMLELGGEKEAYHRGVGIHAADRGIELLLATGELSKNTCDGANSNGGKAVHFETKEELISRLPELVHSGDTVLVKASHSRKFNEIVDALKKL